MAIRKNSLPTNFCQNYLNQKFWRNFYEKFMSGNEINLQIRSRVFATIIFVFSDSPLDLIEIAIFTLD